VRVKICGTTSESDAALALAAGADALGFLIGLDYSTDDEIAQSEARAVIARLPPFVASVLVTHRSDPDWIAATCREIRCGTLQLHGSARIDDLGEIRALVPWVKIVRTVHVEDAAALDAAHAAAEYADAVLLDTKTRTRLGGTGRTHDWSLSAEIVRRLQRPVILAGGLTPENVGQAIALVRPWAVDVNSGVEDARGRKDPQRLRAFVERARATLATIPRS
jgi:phosphoribosylanthranilate isomerase